MIVVLGALNAAVWAAAAVLAWHRWVHRRRRRQPVTVSQLCHCQLVHSSVYDQDAEP